MGEQLSAAEAKTYRIQEMVNANKNRDLSKQELFEMAIEEAFNDEDECPICYEVPMDAPLQTPCRHIFCGECIRGILHNKAECPMCRKKVTIRQLKQPPSKNGDDPNTNNKIEKEQIEQKHDIKDDEIRFDSKLKRLLIALTKIQNNGRNEKALIFTSFSKSLDWVC